RQHAQSRLFFFQAEDGIRDKLVTGVQTCALPIFCHFQEIADFAETLSIPLLLRSSAPLPLDRFAPGSYEHPVPELEYQQGPDFLVPADSARFVFFDDALEGRAVEIVSAGGVPAQECLPSEILQLETEPGIRGHGESLLSPLDYGFREDTLHGPAEESLAVTALDLQFRGERGGKFDELVVEERNAELLCVGHGHFIRLQQKIVGE